MPAPDLHAFSLLPPPYREYRPYHPDEGSGIDSSELRGVALIWSMGQGRLQRDIKVAANRPGGVPLVLVLPEPARLRQIDNQVLKAVEATRPHSVLPYRSVPDPEQVTALLRREPDQLPDEFVDFLVWRGLYLDRETRRIVKRTVELALRVSTLEALSRSVHLSRRALGRRFHKLGLPVPSHWLQMARLLWVCIRLQSCKEPVSRLARSLGYPDGFTLSNQMERVIGVRPSLAREWLGWEWLVEEWLQNEWSRNGLRVRLRGLGPPRSHLRTRLDATLPSMPVASKGEERCYSTHQPH